MIIAPEGPTEPVLWLLYNLVAGGYVIVDGFSAQQLVDGYSGPPQVRLRLPFLSVGHGMVRMPDGALVISISEEGGEVAPPGEPLNYHEGWLVVPASFTGAEPAPVERTLLESNVERIRCGEFGGDVIGFGGGIFAQASSAGSRAVQLAADGSLAVGHNWVAKLSYERLVTHDDLESVPIRRTTGAAGEVTGFYSAFQPGSSNLYWREGDDSLYQIDLDSPTEVVASLKVAKGSNVGATGNWGGAIVFQGEDLWHVRSDRNDILCYTAAQLAALGPTATNPVPAKVLTSPAFGALDAEESLFAMARGADGRVYVSTFYYGAADGGTLRGASLFIFGAEALGGGSHAPIATIATDYSQPITLVLC
jgi:hypothetical protein